MTFVPWAAWPECETVEWRSPDGLSVRFLMLTGAAGRMMPPAAISTLAIPDQDGSRFLGAYLTERILTVPVALPGSGLYNDDAELWAGRPDLRYWAKALNPTRGEGTLTVVQGPFAGRQLRCVYETGLETFEETSDDLNLGTLAFRAAWPYWQDAAESQIVIDQDSTAYTWFPFLPLILGASDAFAVVTVSTVGDVPSWPTVRVTGPAELVTVSNETTGEAWQVTGEIEDGSLLVVDTRPGRKTVRIDDLNAYDRLTEDSALWPLVPGANRVSVAAALTSAETSITFAWRNQWLAA